MSMHPILFYVDVSRLLSRRRDGPGAGWAGGSSRRAVKALVRNCLCATVVACATVAISARAAVDEERTALGALAEGYLANRESFRFIDCRFEYRFAKASTVQDALRGRFTSKGAIRYGHWLVNGSNVRYELICDPAVTMAVRAHVEQEMKKARTAGPKGGTNEVKIECADMLGLVNHDSFSMSYAPILVGANLYPREDAKHALISLTPFNIDIMGTNERVNPAFLLRECLSGKLVGRFLGTERINDVPVMVARVETGEKGVLTKFGFDPVRGYLPVYISDHNEKTGKMNYEAFVTDAKKCSNARWFPMRTVLVSSPDSKPPLNVQEVKVVKLDVDNEPALDRFCLELPKGVQVSVPGRPAWCTLTKTERIAAADLASLYARCVAHGEEYVAKGGKIGVPAHPTASTQGRSWSRITLTASAAVLLAALVWFALKRRWGRAA